MLAALQRFDDQFTTPPVIIADGDDIAFDRVQHCIRPGVGELDFTGLPHRRPSRGVVLAGAGDGKCRRLLHKLVQPKNVRMAKADESNLMHG